MKVFKEKIYKDFYHGDDDKIINSNKKTLYFTDNEEVAKSYKGPKGSLTQADIELQNAPEIDFKNSYGWYLNEDDVEDALKEIGTDEIIYDNVDQENEENQAGDIKTNALVRTAKKTGHDGIIFKNIKDPGPYPVKNKNKLLQRSTDLVVFDPKKQIKVKKMSEALEKNNLYKQFKDEYHEEQAVRLEQWHKNREKLIKKAKTANQGLEPNFDRLGRGHAPCSGYIFYKEMADGELSDEMDFVYEKGRYLPGLEEEKDIWYSHMGSRKILVTEDFQQEMLKDKEFSIKYSGKVWFNKASQCNVVNIWLEGSPWVLNHVEKLMGKYLLLKIEQVPKEEKKAKGQLPVGTQTVTGTIKNLKWVENAFAYNSRIPKLLIELENSATCFGTCPSKLLDLEEDLIGKQITFTAEFEASKEDSSHGYFKRPKQVKLS
jgi:hypothetical protein